MIGLVLASGAADDPCGEAYMVGHALLQQKQYAAAGAEFAKALAQTDTVWRQGACHYRIAECLEKAGDLDGAVEQYAAATRSRRDDRFAGDLGRQRYIRDALKRLTEIAPKTGKGEVVRRCVAEFVRAFPKISAYERSDIYGQAAQTFAAEGKSAEAAAYLIKQFGADKYVTGDAAGRMRMSAADYLSRAGEHEAAVAQLAMLAALSDLPRHVRVEAQRKQAELMLTRLGRIDAARALLQSVLDQVSGGDRARIQLLIAQSYQKQDNFEQAIAAYERLVADQDAPAGNRREAAEQFAGLLAARRQVTEAQAFLLRTIPQLPAHEQQRLLVRLYDLTRHNAPDAALAACDRLIALTGDDPRQTAHWKRDALRRKSELCWDQRKHDEALGFLAQALAVEPHDHNQWLDLKLRIGQWESERGNHDIARETLNLVLADAAADNWKKFRAHTLMSDTYRREKRFSHGRAAVERALALPNLNVGHRADLYWRLGELYRDEQNLDLALEQSARIDALTDINADWRCRSAERAADLLRHGKRYDDAAARLTAALADKRFEPRHRSTLLFMLFRVQREAGAADAATTVARQIIDLDQSKHHTGEAVKWLQQQK